MQGKIFLHSVFSLVLSSSNSRPIFCAGPGHVRTRIHAYIHRASDLSVWLLCVLITDKEHTHTHAGACTDAMTGGVWKCSMCMWDSGAWVHECSCPCSHVEIRVQGPLWRCVHVHRQAHMHWPAVSTLWCLHFFHSTNHSCISLSHHSPAQLSPFHLL